MIPLRLLSISIQVGSHPRSRRRNRQQVLLYRPEWIDREKTVEILRATRGRLRGLDDDQMLAL